MSITVSTEWLFFHLWKRHSQPHGVLIPHTLIYRWTQPMFLYSTNTEGHITRRTKQHINLSDMEDRLQKSPSDVMALTIHTNVRKKSNNKIFEQKHKPQQTNVFQFHTADTFRSALHNDNDRLTMIFQEFVYPRENQLSTIRVNWSPYFCFITKRTAIKSLNDQKASIHQRIATFQSLECLTREEMTSPLLSSDLQRLCDNIANHIENVSSDNIVVNKMVLYFRVDKNDNIQLLFASEVRLTGRYECSREQIGNTQSRLTIKKILFRDPTKAVIEESTGLKNDNKNYCRNCERLVFDLYELSFRQIISATEMGYVTKDQTLMSPEFLKMRKEVAKRKEERLKSQPQPKKVFNSGEEEVKYICDELEMEQVQKKFSDIENIPFLIIKAYGIISKVKYACLKKNNFWLDNCCKVCDLCYINYTQHILGIHKPPPFSIDLHKYRRNKALRQSQKFISSLKMMSQPPSNSSFKSPERKPLKRVYMKKILDKVSTRQEEEIIKQLQQEPRCKFEHERGYNAMKIYGKRGKEKKEQLSEYEKGMRTIRMLKEHLGQLELS